MTLLDGTAWRSAAAQHTAHVDAELADVVARRRQGQKHPVDDFLFQYYNLRPNQLRSWHPGIGVELEDADEFKSRRFHRLENGLVSFDASKFLERRGPTVSSTHQLLEATLQHTPRFGCFGMHEWAMVYRLEPGQTRHPYLPLRFPPEEVARIVEEVGCRCSHVDAFRFFTPSAKPLNLLQPTRENQINLDQPGCLHVNMDLYKWAGKISPAVPAELLFETYLLARDIRVVDMQASAYDLSAWGLSPVRVETPAGRAEYANLQKGFADRALPLRRRLLAVTRDLLHG